MPLRPAVPAGRSPGTFWVANTVELFERAAYYSIASFVVVYLNENLGMDPTFATFLNGSLLWGLLYFLPIVSGTIADQAGFRRSLLFAMAVLVGGYAVLGNVPALAPGGEVMVPVLTGIVLIGVGGSFVKPCIAGTVQRAAAAKATLGFGIFYMVINVGSVGGRVASYFVRTSYGIPALFQYVAAAFAAIGLLVVLGAYREPPADPGRKVRSLGEAVLGIFKVLGNARFVFFLVVISGFWCMYVQIYNLVPLYLRRFVDPNAAVELYTLANPVLIVTLQVLVTRLAGKWRPVRSMMIGTAVAAAGMCLNIVPLYAMKDAPPLLDGALPIAGLFMVGAIGAVAIGEMLAAPRIYEYIGAIAPKGQEGLFLGYANLPMAVGTIVGAPLGGWLFAEVGVARSDPLSIWLAVAP
ncbi:MAG: MFS transporter, partial [Deltaproteobacteria bacterium]|nr:MFS transporter [Deltaproteobacteria bacterium]